MLENKFLRRIINTNPLVLICVFFTLATLMDLILTVIIHGDVGTTYHHLGIRLVICIFVSASLLIFKFFQKLPFVGVIGLHFLAVLLFVILFTWASGFFVEQHPQSMFYMVRSVFIIYIFATPIFTTEIS